MTRLGIHTKLIKRGLPGVLAILLASMFILGSIPPVEGDGMPAVTIVDVDDPTKVFGSIFESRQLARVEQVNDTHERISLFLSVYSMEPGSNLTIMVPLRTLPVDVTGKPMKESDFRDEYRLDKAEDEVVRQDPDEARDKFWGKTSGAVEFCFGSMLLTLPGEYLRENVHQSSQQYEGRKGELDSGGTSVIIEPEPIQHYEFDGFSIDIFGVGAGPLLKDYLAEKGLVLPEAMDLESYEDHYIAVVEGRTKPPIDEDDFDLLLRYVPNSTAELIAELKDDPVRNQYEIEDLKWEFYRKISNEFPWSERQDQVDYGELLGIKDDLIDALFGSTDFEGEVIDVDLPLDAGKVFFPLGTSAGWPNQVGDIDILFKVPEDKDLSLSDSKDAYFEDSHWYLFQMEHANPGFDLESSVMKGSEDRRKEAERAAFYYDNSGVLSALLVVVILLLLWFGLAFALRRYIGAEGKVVRRPLLWILLGASLLISIPGALLAYLIINPLPLNKLRAQVTPWVHLAMYPITIAFFALGAMA
jgi:hypothetical protein